MGKPLARTPPPPPFKGRMVGGSELRQGPLIWRGGPPPMEINVGLTEDKCRVVRGARVVSGMSGDDV
jgi:hypothetical protein